MISGDCNKWDAEVARLLQASVLWTAQIQAGHLSASDTWYALTHAIMKTVEYPMMATYLTKEECEKIMRPFLNAVNRQRLNFIVKILWRPSATTTISKVSERIALLEVGEAM